jgi:short-subunit dehydrogenase
MELAGRTVLLTGASRGIGLAIAHELARHDARVLLGVRNVAEAPSDVPGATPVHLDLASRESIDAGLDAIAQEQIDVLINNAGEYSGGQLEDQDLGLIYAMVQVNVLGMIHLTHRLLPQMLERGEGKIVNQGSIVGHLFMPGLSTYAATKAAVRGFTDCLARELHGSGVSVLELMTGGVDTDMLGVARDGLQEVYKTDTDDWIQYTPEEWAAKVVKAIEDDDAVLGPGGKAELGRLATHAPRVVLDQVSRRAFERR